MWIYIAFILFIFVVLALLWKIVNDIEKLARGVATVLEEFSDEEVQPLQRQVRELTATLGDYPELCRRVERLMKIYQEVRAKAELYENPLEMVARKRES